jgi:SAM-dependent methyltransferase
MARLSMIPVMAREMFGPRTLPRQPETEVMDGKAQVDAYALAGRNSGTMASAYLYHSARISHVIQGCKLILDLACGPATQLAQVAALNRDKHFVGVDLSPYMLENAAKHVNELGLTNVEFKSANITTLKEFLDRSFDAVISTMSLHQLPSLEAARLCFQQIKRVLRPGGAIYIADFARLKARSSAKYFANLNREHQPELFTDDYKNSLLAAFLFEELDTLRRNELPPHAQIVSTFGVPLLTIIKSEDRPLPDDTVHKLRAMRRELPERYRRDLDEIRFFLRMGGLKSDPFS